MALSPMTSSVWGLVGLVAGIITFTLPHSGWMHGRGRGLALAIAVATGDESLINTVAVTLSGHRRRLDLRWRG